MTDAENDGLAAEYVLGSLSATERAEFATRIATDKQLAATVDNWERRLAPLSHLEPGIRPPADVLPTILASIAQDAIAERQSGTIVAIERRARISGRAALELAAALSMFLIGLGMVLREPLRGDSGTLIAVLERRSSNTAADEPLKSTGPVFLATLNMRAHSLDVRQLAGARPPTGKRFAIWFTPSSNAGTVLLGSLDGSRPAATFDFPSQAIGTVTNGRFAVSIEGEGAIVAPTGAFISTGAFEGNPR